MAKKGKTRVFGFCNIWIGNMPLFSRVNERVYRGSKVKAMQE